MEPRILRPKNRTLELKGKLSYCESIQAWNTIRFKRDLALEFPDLMEKRSSFFYKLAFYPSYLELERAIKEMKRGDKPLPILLFLIKGQEAD